MLTLFLQFREFKWVVQALILLGTAPNFFTVWSTWRIVSLIFPRNVFRVVDDVMFSAYQRYLLFFFESCAQVEIILYGDVEDLKRSQENVILLFNHQSTADWLIADMLGARQGSLGRIRYILKDGLKYFPLYGFYFRQHSSIYIDKSGQFNENRTSHHFQQLVNYKVPFWIVLFPEGTRYREDTHKKSIEYAKMHGLPIFDNVLIPRSRAFQIALKELSSPIDAIYDITLGYSNSYDNEKRKRIPPASLSEFLRGDCKKLHIYIKRIPIDTIPKEPELLKTWLINLYSSKDQLMNKFYDEHSEDNFGDDGKVDTLALTCTFPSFLLFIALNAAFLSNSTGRSYYWKSALLGTLAGWSIMFFNP